MLRFAFRGSRVSATRRGATALVAVATALLVSSCLTPITFGEDPENRTGGAPSTSGGGTPSTSGGGAPSTTGGTNQGGEGGQVIPPPPHCENRIIDSDQGETDRDCGGLDCPKCGLGRICEVDSDCVNGSCVSLRCQDPDCTDDVENGDETDTDCGGLDCGPCANGESCIEPEDCLSGVCESGDCAAPTCEDKVENGSESDIDCGGSCDPCDVGATCDMNEDCAQPPEEEAFATCEDNVCTVTCGPFLGDCNETVVDGCETSLLTSVAHCGACLAACAPDNAAGECVAGNCLIDTDAPGTFEGCFSTFANCNGEVDDGCEANLNADATTCGSCDTTCSDANGTPDCDDGSCIISCDPNFDDCNGDVSDGCEADLLVSTLHCTECLNECTATPPEVPVCDGTQCLGITCDQPADCGGMQPCGACDPDTSCNDLLNTTTHCGGCGLDCTAANATTACVDSGGYGCEIASCTGSYADCDLEYPNGCEIETDTNRNRCGDCLAGDPAGGSGVDCDATQGPQVAQTSCSGGTCRVLSCNSGYADCNGTWADGCEINLNTNDDHCGGCQSGSTTTWDGGADCDTVFENGTGVCVGGQCQFSSCNGNYEDCNLNTALDGCETLAQGDPDNCGGCGELSSQYVCEPVNGTNACTGSATTCTPTCTNVGGTPGLDWGDCDSQPWDGCETNLQTSTSNCGGCGTNCTSSMHASGASASCAAANCAIATCDANLADCNGTWSDGCEINISNNTTNCGGCQSGPTTTWDGGANCTSTMHTTGNTAQCSSSTCSIATCDANLADCDGTWSNGCEANTTTSATHCGGCSSGPTTTWDGGTNCTSTMHVSGATAQCIAGPACAIATCDANLADCNGTWSDGCEVNIQSGNTTHCGGCTSGPTTTWDGGVTCTDKTNATVSGCTSGACTYTCASGWFNTDGDWSNGCESRQVVRVGLSASLVSGDLTATPAINSTAYTLVNTTDNYRLLLLGVMCKANTAAECDLATKTYGTRSFTQLGTTTGIPTSWVAMYYMLDSELDLVSGNALVLDNTSTWGAITVQLAEFTGVEQTAPFGVVGHTGTGSLGTNCDTATTDATVSLTGLLSGSYVYAVAGGHGASGTATAVSPLTPLLASGFTGGAINLLFASAGALNQTGNVSNLTVGLTGCYNSVISAAAIKREVMP